MDPLFDGGYVLTNVSRRHKATLLFIHCFTLMGRDGKVTTLIPFLVGPQGWRDTRPRCRSVVAPWPCWVRLCAAVRLCVGLDINIPPTLYEVVVLSFPCSRFVLSVPHRGRTICPQSCVTMLGRISRFVFVFDKCTPRFKAEL